MQTLLKQNNFATVLVVLKPTLARIGHATSVLVCLRHKTLKDDCCLIAYIKNLKSYALSNMASSCFDIRAKTFAKSNVTGSVL